MSGPAAGAGRVASGTRRARCGARLPRLDCPCDDRKDLLRNVALGADNLARRQLGDLGGPRELQYLVLGEAGEEGH